MSTFVMGDIHGAYKALKQCLKRSGFNKETDTLIQLGDVVDGWSQVYECVRELLTIPNLIAIKGNHDEWFLQYMQTGLHPQKWGSGGLGTALSYIAEVYKNHYITFSTDYGKYFNKLNLIFNHHFSTDYIPESHQRFFERQHLYYIDDNNRCFVHAGFDRRLPFKGQNIENYYWDRSLWNKALSSMTNESNKFNILTSFSEIYIGHSATTAWETESYMKAANIYNVDTGAGGNGRLCMMNVDTKEVFYSDNVRKLYSDESKHK